MIALVALTFIDLFVIIFQVLLVVRVVMSYFVKPGSGFYAGLVNLTEPVLGPVRRMLPSSGMIDLAPLATFFLLQGLQYVAHGLIHP